MELDSAGLVASVLALIGTLITYFADRKRKGLEIKNLELENESLKVEIANKKIQENVHVQKLNFYDDVIKLVFVNAIQDAVAEIFKNTSADRFLILIARNGKTDFKFADVILDFFENHSEKVDAVRIYTNVELDSQYKVMLKSTEAHGFFDLETASMPDQILKHFYQIEDVKFGRTMHVARLPIDENNDFLIYTSVAKHQNVAFTDMEKTYFDLIHNNSLRPNIKQLLKVK